MQAVVSNVVRIFDGFAYIKDYHNKPNLVNLLKPTNRPQLTFHMTYIKHVLGLQIAQQNQKLHEQN